MASCRMVKMEYPNFQLIIIFIELILQICSTEEPNSTPSTTLRTRLPRPGSYRSYRRYRDYEPGLSRAALFNLPLFIDWRHRGAITPVIHQGECGSCWSLSATGALESRLYLKTRRMVPLSIQHLIDCSGSFGNHGCHSGDYVPAFRYVAVVGGIPTEKVYPFEARTGYQCKSLNWNITLYARLDPENPFTLVQKGNETDLLEALKTGPVSVSVDAGHPSFIMYTSGVYSYPLCDSLRLTHSMLLVGAGLDENSGQEFWILKNSWGKRWGEKGYMRLARNKGNLCGIATHAAYPNVMDVKRRRTRTA